ncbi:MAG: type II toxin-antitoxin system YoeB family toxin [Protaetiibacter sp.]
MASIRAALVSPLDVSSIRIRIRIRPVSTASSRLLADILRGDPFEGIGGPEPLMHQLAGACSPRIDVVNLLESGCAAPSQEIALFPVDSGALRGSSPELRPHQISGAAHCA